MKYISTSAIDEARHAARTADTRARRSAREFIAGSKTAGEIINDIESAAYYTHRLKEIEEWLRNERDAAGAEVVKYSQEAQKHAGDDEGRQWQGAMFSAHERWAAYDKALNYLTT